jgi:hypothetical protein
MVLALYVRHSNVMRSTINRSLTTHNNAGVMLYSVVAVTVTDAAVTF